MANHTIMSLKTHNQNFNSTAEPKGEMNNSISKWVFMGHKHAASQLHYDFRMEINGVLKRWTILKSTSMNPAEKIVAILVEGFPFSLRILKELLLKVIMEPGK